MNLSILSNSSSQPSSSISSFSLSSPPSPVLKKSSSSKFKFLYEVDYIPEEKKTQQTVLPLVNPYTAFSNSSPSLTRSLKTLLKPKYPAPKEYVQATNFEQCILPAGLQEHFVTLQISEEFFHQWSEQGYTHIHFGAIRIALTFHDRNGILVCIRMALLDTRFKDYKHAVLGIVETTLNARTVFFTVFPNYNMSLHDPTLLDALKVQVQIVGTEMKGLHATLHYQMTYRVQDHAINLTLSHSSDAVFVKMETTDRTLKHIHILKQISSEELATLLPKMWTTSYQKIWKQDESIEYFDPTYKTNQDSIVTIEFDRSKGKDVPPPTIFPTQFMFF